MAKKAKKKTSPKQALSAQALTRQLRAVLSSTPDPDGGGGSALVRGTTAAAVTAAAVTAVLFKCNNPRCIVGMKITGVPGFSFSNQHGLNLGPGTRNVGWKVTSSPSGQSFSVTVSGGTLDVPISGTTGPNSGGVAQLTV